MEEGEASWASQAAFGRAARFSFPAVPHAHQGFEIEHGRKPEAVDIRGRPRIEALLGEYRKVAQRAGFVGGWLLTVHKGQGAAGDEARGSGGDPRRNGVLADLMEEATAKAPAPRSAVAHLLEEPKPALKRSTSETENLENAEARKPKERKASFSVLSLSSLYGATLGGAAMQCDAPILTHSVSLPLLATHAEPQGLEYGDDQEEEEEEEEDQQQEQQQAGDEQGDDDVLDLKPAGWSKRSVKESRFAEASLRVKTLEAEKRTREPQVADEPQDQQERTGKRAHVERNALCDLAL